MTVLSTLRSSARARPVERRLVCPDCGGAIKLSGGLYWCVDDCSFGPWVSLQFLVPAPTTKEAM